MCVFSFYAKIVILGRPFIIFLESCFKIYLMKYLFFKMYEKNEILLCIIVVIRVVRVPLSLAYFIPFLLIHLDLVILPQHWIAAAAKLLSSLREVSLLQPYSTNILRNFFLLTIFKENFKKLEVSRNLKFKNLKFSPENYSLLVVFYLKCSFGKNWSF